MRIHLYIGEGNALVCANSKAKSKSERLAALHAQVPPSLTALTPNGELVLIELQGELELSGLEEEDGDGESKEAQVLGKLAFEQGIKEHPVLTISHHRLEGKIVTLQKPLAVLEKKQRGPKRKAVSIVLGGDDDDADAEAAEGRPSKRIASASASASASHNVESQVGSQSQSQAPEEDESGSQRYMFEETMQDSITTSVRGGAATSKIKLRPPPPPTDSQEEDSVATAAAAAATHDSGGVKSSSPLRPPPARGDLLDFSSSPVHPSSDRPFAPSSIAPRSSPPPPSSPTAAAAAAQQQQQHGRGKRKASAAGVDAWDEDENEAEKEDLEGGAHKGRVRIDPTATYYEVVSIIRKKIVFSKRPEPIVRLEKFA